MTDIFLLCGPEAFLKEEEINRLREAVRSKDAKTLNHEVFYGEDSKLDFKTALNTGSFFNEKKLVVIKNVDRLSASGKKGLKSYLEKPNPQTLLVLESAQYHFQNDFLSTLARYAKVIKCNKLNSAALYNWIYKRAEGFKKRISKEASDLLLELKGGDLRSLSMELEKLADYTGGRPEINVGDVEDLVGRNLSGDVFGLVDAVSRRDSKSSLSLVSLFVRNKRKESEIIGLLAWHIRRLLKAKELEKSKEAKTHIAKLLKIPARYTEKFFNQLSHFDIESIKRSLKILIEADRDLKTGGERRIGLELMVVRLCRV